MTIRIPAADAPFEIVWDKQGIPHVHATTTADAYRGMGYAAGRERLWQIHQSTAYANCEAAALLGERFVAQDAIQRACNVHGRDTGLAESSGDWIADAYLDGLNTVVDELDTLPPEFEHARATPRRFTRADIAARYRFTSWFQHKSWTEKMAMGRLMATHGVDWFKHHVLHFSDADVAAIDLLKEPLQTLSTQPYALAYPEAAHLLSSGSNNWAVTGALSVSGKPILATDPHQPHTIPNTFFYVHLHAPDLDVFGAAFPGVPYFMMGTTRHIAWGLTTGFIDCYDIYLERLNELGQYEFENRWYDQTSRTEHIEVRAGTTRDINIARTRHGPLLEPLCRELGIDVDETSGHASALHWSLTDVPTSAGALAQLPLATSAEEFGHYLYENDVCPLVNNIICTDVDNGLRRFIAATLPARKEITGSVPLPGWSEAYEFPLSTETDLTVEIDPQRQFSLTANNDTMGESGPYYIHTFPANSARADRINEILEGGSAFTIDDFKAAQLDLKDLRALDVLPELLSILAEADDPRVRKAHALLSDWNGEAAADEAAPCLFYPFQDRLWARKFMRKILKDDPVIASIPNAAPGLNLFDIKHFLASDSPWNQHRATLCETIHSTMAEVVQAVEESLGADTSLWRWGDLHQIRFGHRLAKHSPWQDMHVGPDPIGGSATTLGMAMHMGPGPGRAKADEIPCRVYHGPAFRLIVDLADPAHIEFVIAGGNGGSSNSSHSTDQYAKWLRGEYHTVSFLREEWMVEETWKLAP